MKLVYGSYKLNEYKLITAKRLFDRFNERYHIFKIYEKDGTFVINSRFEIKEKDESISFKNVIGIEKEKNNIIYLVKNETKYSDTYEFMKYLKDYNFFPINIFYINCKKVCIESFNKFFNLSINGFSLVSSNNINLKEFDINNIDKIIIEELENRKE